MIRGTWALKAPVDANVKTTSAIAQEHRFILPSTTMLLLFLFLFLLFLL